MTLGNMTALESMKLYVKAVEQDNPDWWALLTRELDDSAKRVLITTAKVKRCKLTHGLKAPGFKILILIKDEHCFQFEPGF